MKIAIIGTGYVGLVSGATLAETGVSVTCVDIDESKINNLKKGIIPIYEPGLEPMVKRNLASGRLKFSSNLAETIKGCKVAMVAVGTPSDEDGSADLQYVLGVAKEIGQNMNGYLVVITKSTVPVGTAEKVRLVVQQELKKRESKLEFDVASNPEFLKEGDAINDSMKPDRIVVGTDSHKAYKIIEKLYKPFVLNGHPVLFMDIPSAELTKYAANSMLATKISFINDIANLCELVGADINNVRRGIGTDSRIGHSFIYAGAGYGGSCFPKDVKAIIKTADELGYKLKVLKAVEEVNDKQKELLFTKVNSFFNGELKGKKIAMWGLAFKPNTDDMRDAPSLTLIDKFIEAGAEVMAYDPIAIKESKRRIGDKIKYAKDAYTCVANADCLLLITEWNEFRNPNWDKISELMSQKAVFDGRNIYEKNNVVEAGFSYVGIGR